MTALDEFVCPDCGCLQPVNWRVPDEHDVPPFAGYVNLWKFLNGLQDLDGKVCPACFDKHAESVHIALRWVPVLNGFCNLEPGPKS